MCRPDQYPPYDGPMGVFEGMHEDENDMTVEDQMGAENFDQHIDTMYRDAGVKSEQWSSMARVVRAEDGSVMGAIIALTPEDLEMFIAQGDDNVFKGNDLLYPIYQEFKENSMKLNS